MITRLFVLTVPGFLLGALLMALANRRVSGEVARARWLKLIVYCLIVHVMLGVAAIGQPWVTWLMASIVVASAVEMLRALQRGPSPRPPLVLPVFVFASLLAVAAAWRLPPATFAFVYLVTATCDGFSQVVGQLLGRRKLAPQVSPAKTVEGLAGGLVAAITMALLVQWLLPDASAPFAVTLGVAVGIAGLAGDLAASWVKRRVGIKDYSAALPGQGGFLDRFDSLLGALAIVGTALALLAR